MTRPITVAATQMACSWKTDENVATAQSLVRKAVDGGAQIVLLQELFETPYFCIEQDRAHFALARPVDQNPLLETMADLARETSVVLPVSFFEKAGNAYFNSLVIIDADGSQVAHYRKSHIPDGPGYQEKFYFSPGDTGFCVADTAVGRIGVAICWDQWFPEAARSMALAGAELLFYPTAIGSEPPQPGYDSSQHWQRVMQGHAAANLVPVIASNRIGMERGKHTEITFYGSSFITDPHGAVLTQASREDQAVITASLDLDSAAEDRAAWGLFRDRRPDLYGRLMTLDGGG